MKQMICAAAIALTLMFAFPVRIQASYALAEPEEPGTRTQTADFTQNGTRTADFTHDGTRTADFTQEQSAYITEEPADSAQTETVSSEQVPDAEAVPDSSPESVSAAEATPEDIPDNVPENALDNVPEDVPENVLKNVPESVPERETMPENIPDGSPVESAPENRSGEKVEMSADVPDSICADDASICTDDADDTDYAEVTPEDVPESNSAVAVPENVPEAGQAVLSDDDGDEKYYTVTVENGTGSGFYREGDTVTVSANPAPHGKRLRGWTRPADLTLNFVPGTVTLEATFTMPAKNVTLIPTYEDMPLYTVTVVGGVGGGKYYEGDTVRISADPAPAGKQLRGWSRPSSVAISYVDASTLEATFVMPAKNVRVVAVYQDIPLYTVTVEGGTVEGGTEEDGVSTAQFYAGDTVHIQAYPAPEGMRLRAWSRPADIPITFVSGTVTLEATFTMPAKDVALKALYDDLKALQVTVIGGTGSGTYAEGDIVSIAADPAPEGKRLKGWLMSGTVALQWKEGSTQTLAADFVMPGYSVTLTATSWDIVPGPGNETDAYISIRNSTVSVETRVRGGEALNGSLLTAAYDEDGRLLAMGSGTLTEGKGEIEMNLSGAKSVSAFILDSRFHPLTGTFSTKVTS